MRFLLGREEVRCEEIESGRWVSRLIHHGWIISSFVCSRQHYTRDAAIEWAWLVLEGETIEDD